MILDAGAQAVFIVVWFLIAWTQVGYLLALTLIGRGSKRRRETDDLDDGVLPTVTILVPVFNGRSSISAKIANSLALDYPSDKLSVVVASDGSTDGTPDIARQSADPRVEVFESPQRRGRALITNDVFARCRTDWIVSTDVDTRMRRDFLRHMAVHFVDPTVGVVDGAIDSANSDATATAHDVGLYWILESRLKQLESDLGVLASTFGNCTAVRRAVFRPLDPTGDIDFLTPLDAISLGYRVIHEPAARVEDVAHPDLRGQIRARARMVTKNMPGTLRMLPLVGVRPGVILAILSHKVLRWFTPVLLVLAFLINCFLAISHPLYRVILGLQIAFYALGALGAVRFRSGRQIPLASSVLSFLAANLGFLIGIVNVVRGVRIAAYQPYSVQSSSRDVPA